MRGRIWSVGSVGYYLVPEVSERRKALQIWLWWSWNNSNVLKRAHLEQWWQNLQQVLQYWRASIDRISLKLWRGDFLILQSLRYVLQNMYRSRGPMGINTYIVKLQNMQRWPVFKAWIRGIGNWRMQSQNGEECKSVQRRSRLQDPSLECRQSRQARWRRQWAYATRYHDGNIQSIRTNL